MQPEQVDIEKYVNIYKKKRIPNKRYTSFDYCYNYFKGLNADRDSITEGQYLLPACLQLGFYLASWGMFRGSSFLMQSSLKVFEPLISTIMVLDKTIWDIDVDKYNAENVDILINCYNKISTVLIPDGKRDLTLVTKIMLGVFGCVPAFDNLFCDSFREFYKGECGFRKFNKKSLKFISLFYQDHRLQIDECSSQITTLDYVSGNPTSINYTKAKIIDMVGFEYGSEKGRDREKIKKSKTPEENKIKEPPPNDGENKTSEGHFDLTLYPSYYRMGFFNISIDQSNLLGAHKDKIIIYIGESAINGYIDRKANLNGTPRIMSGAKLRDAFKKTYKEGDTMSGEIISPFELKLGK